MNVCASFMVVYYGFKFHECVFHFGWNLKIARFIFISSFEVVQKLSFKLLVSMCVHVCKCFIYGIILWDPKAIKSISISNFKVLKKIFLNFSCHYILCDYAITIYKCEIQTIWLILKDKLQRKEICPTISNYIFW